MKKSGEQFDEGTDPEDPAVEELILEEQLYAEEGLEENLGA